jgi:sialic acid synthase SpsE
LSAYPAPPEEANLLAMRTLSRRFGLPTGFSDHTEGIAVTIAAAALGAAVIEKHFTLDKSLPGPDHRMSLSPAELKALVRGVRDAAAALGDGRKAPRSCEKDVLLAARRSLVLARTARAGEPLREGMLLAKRPGSGIPPSKIREVLGRALKRDAAADTVLQWGMLR